MVFFKMWVLVENLQYPLYLYDFSSVWIVWWLVMCELWLKAFAQAWHFTEFSWLNSLIYCEVWALTKGFSTFIPLRVLLWNEMLAVLFQKHFAHQLPWWVLSRVTSDLLDVLQGRSSGWKFCHSHCTFGVSLLCVPWWSIGGNPDWMPSHSHCICRDWVSLHCAFWCSLRAECPWKVFPHSKHTCGSSSMWMDCCWLCAVRSLKPYPPLPHF